MLIYSCGVSSLLLQTQIHTQHTHVPLNLGFAFVSYYKIKYGKYLVLCLDDALIAMKAMGFNLCSFSFQIDDN